jgi:CO/xanthine dehydrogenase FAD-binding subunit
MYPSRSWMKPAPFHFERPESVSEAIELLASKRDRAKVLAGGQSLVPLMNLRLAAPDIVVDIGRLDDLRYVRADNGSLRVGAMTTQATLEESAVVAETCPLLAEAIRFIGHRAIRNRGTVGGSIAHADPAAELPLVLLALRGEVTVASERGSRSIAADDFFQGFLTTAVEPTELVTEVSFPAVEEGNGYAFEEFARRPGDFGLVSVACALSGDGDAISSARVALGGLAPVPLVLDEIDGIRDMRLENAIAAIADAAAAVDVVSDIHASSEYRQSLAGELTRRALKRASGERG